MDNKKCAMGSRILRIKKNCITQESKKTKEILWKVIFFSKGVKAKCHELLKVCRLLKIPKITSVLPINVLVGFKSILGL